MGMGCFLYGKERKEKGNETLAQETDTERERERGPPNLHPCAMAMRDSNGVRAKVVVRRLPPSLSEAAFMEQMESRFAGLYDWVSFFPGNPSHKSSLYSRAHVHFKQPEDVVTFSELFDGHNFVNEKGVQYKALVEYSPYQRVPKLWLKKDMREGTIITDPEYLDFLQQLAKPAEYLSSAEVQLDRREAERVAFLCGGGKDSVIVTPLMEFVRQKRALKSTSQRLLSQSAKLNSRAGSAHAVPPNILSKRGADRSRTSLIHLLGPTSGRQKEKSAYVPRREESPCQGHELAVQRKKENFETMGKLVTCSPATSVNNQLDTHEKFNDTNMKDISIAAADPAAQPAAYIEGQKIDSYDFESGKASSAIDETNISTDVYGYESRKKKQMEIEKLVPNDAVIGDSMSSSSVGGGKVTPKNQVITAKLVPRLQPLSPKQQGATSPGRLYSVASGCKTQHKDGAIRLKQRAPSSTQVLSQSDLHAERRPPKPQKSPPSTQALSQSDLHLERRPPKPQNLKVSARILSHETETGVSLSDRVAKVPVDERRGHVLTNNTLAASEKEGRRLKNKDRPDRPVWTVRHRSEATSHLSAISVSNEGDRSYTQFVSQSVVDVDAQADLSEQEHTSQRDARNDFIKSTSRSASIEPAAGQGFMQISSSSETQGRMVDSPTYWNDIGGNHRQTRHDRGTKDVESMVVSSENSKPSRRSMGAVAYGGHEKQVWVAKSGSAS